MIDDFHNDTMDIHSLPEVDLPDLDIPAVVDNTRSRPCPAAGTSQQVERGLPPHNLVAPRKKTRFTRKVLFFAVLGLGLGIFIGVSFVLSG